MLGLPHLYVEDTYFSDLFEDQGLNELLCVRCFVSCKGLGKCKVLCFYIPNSTPPRPLCMPRYPWQLQAQKGCSVTVQTLMDCLYTSCWDWSNTQPRIRGLGRFLFLSLKLIFLYFFHYHLVPLCLPPPSNHHLVVHESFFPFTQSFHPLTSPAPKLSSCSPSMSLSPFSLLV